VPLALAGEVLAACLAFQLSRRLAGSALAGAAVARMGGGAADDAMAAQVAKMRALVRVSFAATVRESGRGSSEERVCEYERRVWRPTHPSVPPPKITDGLLIDFPPPATRPAGYYLVLAEVIISCAAPQLHSLTLARAAAEKGSATQRRGTQVEAGSAWECTVKVVLLRLTPVVPYAVSNYLLGLTELKAGPFLVGTTAGMLPWAVFYVLLGAGGRNLLVSGEDPSLLVAGASPFARLYFPPWGSQNGAQLACRPGTAVKLLWPAVNPALTLTLTLGLGARERSGMGVGVRSIGTASACGGLAATHGARRRDCFWHITSHHIKAVGGACTVVGHPAPPSVHVKDTLHRCRKPVQRGRRVGRR
jgi:uncharacterized membrane protein YdjX (TVP38/TMEM64 family)